jgi:hypothetical protein
MVEGAGATARPQTLDDLMMAMDVVDTLRHREKLVERELDEEGREAELIARLREIYRQQGIEVTDEVLAEGVKALRDSRFVYTPPPAGLKRTLFTFWVRRWRVGRNVLTALAVFLVLSAAYYFGVSRPAERAREQARIEIEQTLPQAIRGAHTDIAAVASDPEAKARADALLNDGERAIRGRDRAGMERARTELLQLRDRLNSEYTLTIVSRPGEPSGGRRLSLPVRNEETGDTEVVSKFGVRVPEQVYEAVARDKRDDGIVQNNIFGTKRRGTLAVDYKMPFEGGMITRW